MKGITRYVAGHIEKMGRLIDAFAKDLDEKGVNAWVNEDGKLSGRQDYIFIECIGRNTFMVTVGS
jgi:hypothetical protein